MAQIPLLTVSERAALEQEQDQDIELHNQIPGNGKSAHDALIRSRDSKGDLHLERGSEESQGYTETQKKRRRNVLFEGWKFTVFLAFIASLIVLFFNVGFVLYSTTHNDGKANTTLYEGNCEKVHRLSIGFHLLINTLSTVLLGASNFGMQCLAAPNRQMIDEAHNKDRWLDIGVPSIRNVFRVSYKRSFLWLCLACSSLPFHLMYNSTVYATTAASAYDVWAGPASYAHKTAEELGIDPSSNSSIAELYNAIQNDTLVHLENTDCLNSFATTYQTTYSKLWVVSNITNTSTTFALVYTNPIFEPVYSLRGNGPYDWICPESPGLTCNSGGLSTVRSDINNGEWSVGDPESRTRYTVQYCMAMKKPQHCKLQYSFPLTMVVIVFNIVKTSVLLYMWLGISEVPLLTIGDAIASFLRRPDPCTRTGCLLTGAEVRSIDWRTSATRKQEIIHGLKIFNGKQKRWGSAASSRRWTFSVIIWLLAIIVCIVLLAYGNNKISANGVSLNPYTIALGDVNASTLIYADSWPSTLLSNVLIANTPQLLFSCLYFAFNSILTCMCVAAEWSSYANKRKSLRVSNNPQLAQRSNYFLSIPYRYAIPLIVLSITLHWLISESLFMVGVEAWDNDMQRDPSGDVISCAYTPVAILSSILIGAFMFTSLVALSRQRLESAMPVAGSCSLAIAAACHPRVDPNQLRDVVMEDHRDEEEEDMGLLPVQWGAIPVEGPLGHSSFTSRDVDMPGNGKEYQ